MSRYFNVSIGTTAALIIADNCNRKEVIIVNHSDDNEVVVYIGQDDSVTPTTGIPLYENQTRGHARGFGSYLGPIYGVTESGTADVRVWETT